MAYVSIFCLIFLLHSCGGGAITSKTKCQVIPPLLATEPDTSIPSETSSLEFWNAYSDQLECAGVGIVRYTIKPNAHLLPLYINAEEVFFVVQGSGIFSLIIPTCSQELDGEKNECHKIFHLQSGDVLALRGEETFWGYNSGNETFIIIIVSRISNAGPIRDQQKRKNSYNVKEDSFYNINTRISKISDPSRADLFIPELGYFTTIDVHQIPILESTQISVSYNLLLKDVMRLPHWENSYTLNYVMKGEGHIQVVDDNGKNVFDDIIRKGQLLLVPHSFLMAEQAKSEMFEYATFKTTANPITSELSGRNSVINCLPLEIIRNAFQLNKEEAKKVKFGRKETSLAKIIPKYI
ncbi:11S globulin seed storage protein Ana o 2.0101-like [Euphorbia lathyris]|uniref:11S globulin seed storage protein Ana o 2.0101-like n=1 Tax=Euphorbia lathyris TaxID=212925 RepID=UPI0033144017